MKADQVQLNRIVQLQAAQFARLQPAVQLQAAQFAQIQAAVQLQPLPLVQLRPAGGIDCCKPDTRPIVLCDGKWRDLPTAHAGAVRMRVLPKKMGEAKREDILLALQIAAEPKIRWRSATAVHIEKAVDERGQALKPRPTSSSSFSSQNVFDAAPVRGSVVPLALRKGDKPSKALKELRGVVTAEVLSDPMTILTVDNVLKAEGKTFRFADGWLKIVKVQHQGDRIQVWCELTAAARSPEYQSRNPFQLSLVDASEAAKDKALGEPNHFTAYNGSPTKLLVEGKLPKGRHSVRLLLSCSRTITLTIPFVFRDVPLH
jgi:hypothetical protein